MALDFNTISEQDALRLIGLASDPLADSNAADRSIDGELIAGIARKYIAGDHWQDGKGWIGPTGKDLASGSSDSTMLRLIEERFISRNMILDVTRRHRSGVVGREPQWSFTPVRALADEEEPTEEEQKQIDAIEAAITTWWDKRKIPKLIRRALTETLGSSRAVLRLFVPTGRLVELAPAKLALVSDNAEENVDASPAERGVVASSIADALDQIFVEVLIAEDGAVYTDPDTMDQIGIVTYQRQFDTLGASGQRIIELTYLDGTPDMPRAERNTVIRLIGDETAQSTVTFALGGRLTHFAIEREPMITEQMISLQKALNFTLTMLSRNEETNGFLERILSNVQMPGTWDVDENGDRTGSFTLGEYVTGPATTMSLQGAEVTDAAGNTTLATPGITFRPNVDNSTTITSKSEFRAEILLEAKQGHLLSTDQALSGFSRVQTRADFEKSLTDSKTEIDPAGRWLLETTISLAQLFANDAEIGDVSQYRCEFSSVIDTGPLDPTEVTNAITAKEKGVVSREFAMQAVGVEDTDAERARINSEPGKDQAIRQAKAATLKAFTDAGLSMAAAAELAGFDTKEIALIKKDELNPPIPAPAPGNMIPKIDPATGKPLIDPKSGQPVMEPDPKAPPAANAPPANIPPASKPPQPAAA